MRAIAPLLAYIFPLVLLSVGCSIPQPGVIEANLPSDTDDPTGPYIVAVQTWGVVERAKVEWTVEPGEPEITQRQEMTLVRPNHWETAISGAPAGTKVSLRIILMGAGDDVQFPASEPYVFKVVGNESPCGGRCAPGTTCIDDVCKTDDCLNDNDCPPGQICDGGQCKLDVECTGDEECGNGRVCRNGTCVPPPMACGEGGPATS